MNSLHSVVCLVFVLLLAAACPGGENNGGGEPPACEPGLSTCGETCVDLDSAIEHCGACYQACRRPGASAICVDGECVDWSCEAGFEPLREDPADGCRPACSGIDLHASGVLDFDLNTIEISGRVTVRASDPEASTGGSRGLLYFHREGSTRSVELDLGGSGPADFSTRLFPGRYLVEVLGLDCPDGGLPCGSHILRSDLELTVDGYLDLDIDIEDAPQPPRSFLVSGQITVNGQTMGAASGSNDRGQIVFAAQSGHIAHSPLGRDGPATYEVSLTEGVYDIWVENTQDCVGGALPCLRRTIHREMRIIQSGNLDIDLGVVRVEGVVKVNGQDLTESTSGSSRGSLLLTDAEGTMEIGLGTSGPAAFDFRIFTGEYEVAVAGSTDCSPSNRPSIPCQKKTTHQSLGLFTNGTLDIDLTAVEVRGEVRVNGASMSASPSSSNRGRLLFDGEYGAVAASIGESGPASYEVWIYPGRYSVSFTGQDCAVIPCQSRTLQTDIGLTSSGFADFDLPVIDIDGRVTLNGRAMPASETSSVRGKLVFEESEGAGQVIGDLGAEGPAVYEVRLFPGTYEVSFDNLACIDTVLPCQRRRLRSISLSTGGALDLDLAVAEVFGEVRVHGAPMVDSPNGRGRGSVVFAGPEGGAPAASVGTSGPASWSTRVFHDSYDLHFVNENDCPGAVPCHGVLLREGLSIRANGAIDLDLTVIELSGKIEVDGRQMSTSVSGSDRGTLRLMHLGSGSASSAGLGVEGSAVYHFSLFPGAYVLTFDGGDCPAGGRGATPCQDIVLAGCEI